MRTTSPFAWLINTPDPLSRSWTHMRSNTDANEEKDREEGEESKKWKGRGNHTWRDRPRDMNNRHPAAHTQRRRVWRCHIWYVCTGMSGRLASPVSEDTSLQLERPYVSGWRPFARQRTWCGRFRSSAPEILLPAARRCRQPDGAAPTTRTQDQ